MAMETDNPVSMVSGKDTPPSDDETASAAGLAANWHFAIVHTMTSTDADADPDATVKGNMKGMMGGTWVMTIAQMLAVMGIFLTTVYKDCVTNDNCAPGLYCNGEILGGSCNFCGSSPPLPMQVDEANGGVLNAGVHPEFIGHNETLVVETCTPPFVSRMGVNGGLDEQWYSPGSVANWCDACHHAETGRILTLTLYVNNQQNYAMMSLFDKMAMYLCAVYIGLKMAHELGEIEVCRMLLRRAGDDVDANWRRLFKGQNFIRRYLFLPALIYVVPIVILALGGAVCLP
jgi:hypothetical protein